MLWLTVPFQEELFNMWPCRYPIIMIQFPMIWLHDARSGPLLKTDSPKNRKNATTWLVTRANDVEVLCGIKMVILSNCVVPRVETYHTNSQKVSVSGCYAFRYHVYVHFKFKLFYNNYSPVYMAIEFTIKIPYIISDISLHITIRTYSFKNFSRYFSTMLFNT